MEDYEFIVRLDFDFSNIDACPLKGTRCSGIVPSRNKTQSVKGQRKRNREKGQ